MAVFSRVVDEGSFRGAAKSLGVSPSRVSETVSDLEAVVGTTLLYRTTRKLALTESGRLFYESAAAMVKQAEAGFNQINARAIEPMGSLRISAPAYMASSKLSTALGTYLQQHPKVRIIATYSDDPVDLLNDGYDLNIRVGWLDDSSMMSRKLGEHERVVVAGTKYASSKPIPLHPSDLRDWDWIKYEHRAIRIEMTSPTGETVNASGPAQIQVNTIEALRHFTLENFGVTALPRHMAQDGLSKGSLTRLLPEWTLRNLGIFAVWPDTSRRENLTLSLVRHLANQL